MPERGYYNWTPLGSGLITETSSLAAAGGESQSSVTLSSPPICSLLLYWPSNINQLINKQKVGNYRWKCKSKSADRLPSVSYSCVSCFMSLLSRVCLYPLPPLVTVVNVLKFFQVAFFLLVEYSSFDHNQFLQRCRSR